MKTYLVTGCAGFIGSNFVHYMLEKYQDIRLVNLDKLTYAGNLENLEDIKDDARHIFVKGDICDKALVTDLIAKYDPDYVINFAAESHVDRSIRNPEIFVESNVLGTVNLLQCCKDAWYDADAKTWKEGKKYLQVSTDEVYGALGADGYFMETYQKDQFAEAGIDKEFVQDNQSRSTRGVLRGLHFQKNHTQGKLVRVTMGEVYDVAVDCRPNSKTFGKWVGATLSADNKKMLWIPEGFAHGFVVLSDVAEFCYKCTDVYDPTAEGGIPYDDPTVNVQWPDCGCEHKTSAKDKEHTPFAEQKFEYFEKY